MVADPPLDRAFHALSHPTRRAMLALLREGERTVGELAAPFRTSLAASSKHLRVLEDAGLVHRRVAGRTHVCSLEPAPLRDVAAWTEGYRAAWERSFRRLDTVLDDLKAREARRAAGKGTRRRRP